MKKDYYKVLELDRRADGKAIKAAYRRLARKYHPDLNPNDKAAEAKFKEVSEAYEVLGDDEKRKLYDQYGEHWEAIQRGGGVPTDSEGFGHFGGDFATIFEQFFGGSHDAAHQPRRRAAEPRDVERTVELTLEEIDAGCQRTLTYQVMDSCKSCEGTGQVRLRAPQTCAKCGGSGVARGMFGMNQTCPECGGTGRTTLETCPTCRGDGVMSANRRVEVKIPAGISDGKKLRVPGRGSVGAQHRAGDLYVVIKEIPHAKFRRRGEDLETDVEVLFTRAILGGEIQVPTLRGQVTMKLPPGTQNNQTFRLANQGISSMKGGRGNLLVRVHITVPKSVDTAQRKLVEQLATALEGTLAH